MSNEVTIGEEAAIARNRNESLSVAVGAIAGALIGGGLVWAYRRSLRRQAEEGCEPQAQPAIGFSDLARLGLSVLGLLRQVAELGR